MSKKLRIFNDELEISELVELSDSGEYWTAKLSDVDPVVTNIVSNDTDKLYYSAMMSIGGTISQPIYLRRRGVVCFNK